jgi:DNA recombination-dependent growth factor C
MNYLDLLPDDLIEIINKKLIELQNKERRKIRKETKRTAKQYKFCEKLLKKAYSKYNNILDYKFCIGGEITYIKVNFIDSRFNEFVTILMSHNF